MNDADFFGKKNLLSKEDYEDAQQDRAQQISQEIFNHLASTYRKTDGSGTVATSLMAVAAIMAKEFSEGKCTKDLFVKRAEEMWDVVVAVRVGK